jgi:hypothetical protein
MSETVNPVGTAFTRVDDGKRSPETTEERVSLAPLDPETALKGLLATPKPPDDEKD